MTERPILFNGAMVRALLEGRKTQTRRIVKPQPHHAMTNPAGRLPSKCPYGRDGDRLWVRETLRQHAHFGFPLGPCEQVRPIQGRIWSYAADNVPDPTGTRVSIHMPRWACRLVLEITMVRAERLQELTLADAMAEGLFIGAKSGRWTHDEDVDSGALGPVAAYIHLWDKINGKAAPWSANPWVWVVEFKRVAP